MGPRLRVEWLGTVPYAEALERQHKCVESRRAEVEGDTLLLLEHPPVVTLGRRADGSHLLQSREQLAARGVGVHETARGGDVTYHGPGQLVGYLIVDLAARDARDVHRFLRAIEAALCEAVGELGVRAAVLPGMTGVFVDGARPPRKLASIGVGMRGWITWHGFALNATVDLAGFAAIVPCGLHDVEMTSLARELDASAPPSLFERTREAVADAFVRRLG